MCEVEQPEGVIVQFGGQTPLKLAAGLRRGRHPDPRHRASTRSTSPRTARGSARCSTGSATRRRPTPPRSSAEEALERAPEVGFPLLVRPSYVLGGRAMEIVYSVAGLRDYLERVGPEAGHARSTSTASSRTRSRSTSTRCATAATCGSPGSCSTSRRPGSTPATRPACCRRTRSARRCSTQIREQTAGIATALGVVGLLNVQFAIHGDDGLHVIEANPRASRTVPFVSKAIGLPLAKLACRIMLGERLADLDLPAGHRRNGHVCVKEVVLPFDRFAGADSLLGPEMRSTGEVMGIARDFPTAFAKAQAAAGAAAAQPAARCSSPSPTATSRRRPASPPRCTTSASRSSPRAAPPRRSSGWGSRREAINKIGEGSPHVVDWIERGEVDLVINTPVGTGARTDGYEIRSAAVARGIPCITTMAGGMAAARAIAAARRGEPEVLSLQEIHAPARGRGAIDRRTRRPGAVRPPRGRRSRARAARRLRRAALRRPRRPAPAGRAVLHAQRRRAVGRGRRRAAVPAARVQRAARAARAERRARSSCSRTSGPGTKRLCELEPGDELLLVGPLGNGFAPPRDGRRPLLVGGGVGIAPLAIWQDELGAEHAAALLGFRDARARRRGARCSRDARVATDDGSVGHHGLVTELLAERARPRRQRRGLRLRAAADARGGARAVRRARRPGPARARVGDGLRLRRLLRLRGADPRAATCGCASTARCSTPRSSRPRSSRERDIDRSFCGHRARAPDHQRLGDVRRDRRPARVRRRSCSSASRSPRSSPRR